VSQGDLARYVVHRNIILSVLERLLEVGEDGKASLEESIHRLICPMRISDDGTMELESHNLWIIDERLAFHNYLSSDLPLSNVDPIESASGEEPDILIFDGPMSFTDESEEPYRKISIIEFKRPIKEAHSPKYNPLRQIRRYAVEILNGEVRKKGRRIEVSNEVRFFGYAIAEYSDSIDDVRKEWGHALLPNGDGSVGYGKDENILYEVIPYKRLLRDAKKRNAAFFRRLKL
jgi:hypothetical protein